ncbi:hypothetical protein WS89_02670 [Burkholderia sp. MSMB1072]|uniref:hypothetical protein n=1 Tax=Burkholderia sp. MSMB1072 TaxID=1637871 RepID=UPI00075940BE|nr:hypothetical protein [Burkholderia sp. MSMB1072]KVH53742.1 hypothetical protein WS89_02670 [Burkholderia sp. MSMB1072]
MLFGGAVRYRLRVLLVLDNCETARDIELAEEKLTAGEHDLFLVRLGKGELSNDVARAVAIKAALGDHAHVHVDANQC